jgi:hypothetical protein
MKLNSMQVAILNCISTNRWMNYTHTDLVADVARYSKAFTHSAGKRCIASNVNTLRRKGLVNRKNLSLTQYCKDTHMTNNC